ncbi:hypothetical protein [Flectobacillus major]|uniref:hypothetical protein n=1 Tax=Flectobacillus major TaxID=103 RepID=UPI00040DB0CC|nr:hypothetical protein [Flectobacillus major]
MKKHIQSFLVAFLLMITPYLASSQALQQGDRIINAGIGLLAFGGYANAEFGIQDNIGIGPMIGYTYYNAGLLTGYSGNYNYGQLRVGARGAYHLGDALRINDNSIDPYVALSVGLLFDRNNYVYNNQNGQVTYANRTLPFFNPRAGVRMPLSENLGGYAEVGWGGSWIQAGVSFNF